MTILVRALAISTLLLFAAVCGCGQLKEEGRAIAGDVVDCTKAEAVKAIEQYAPAVEQVIVDSIGGDGKLDKDRVLAATKTFGTNSAKCVLASTIHRLMSPPASSPDAPQSSPLAVDLAGLHSIRTEQLGAQRYKLPGGGTL